MTTIRNGGGSASAIWRQWRVAALRRIHVGGGVAGVVATGVFVAYIQRRGLMAASNVRGVSNLL